MNKDFHYYATFYVAHLAGFNADQAQKIAWAAAMVDELNKSMAKKKLKNDDEYVMTVQTGYIEMARNTQVSDNWNSDESHGIRGVWVPFHFLPGHFDGGIKEFSHNEYQNQISDGYIWSDGIRGKVRDRINSYFKDKETRRYIDACLKLRCGKNSETVLYMLDYFKSIYASTYDEDESLYALGICMHVLADTWAHDNFSGISCYFVNEGVFMGVHPDATDYLDKKNVSNKEDAIKYLTGGIAEIELKAINSAVYQGHAPVNRAPDYDFFSYRYFPRYVAPNVISLNNFLYRIQLSDWSIRNPKRFEEAFKGLYLALRYIQGADEMFSLDKTCMIEEELEKVRREVFEVWPIKDSKLITSHDDIVAFKEKVWKDYIKMPVADFSEESGDIHRFARQAKWYRHFILTYINKKLNSIYQNNPPVSFDEEKIEDWTK